jgi:hypothetical protein
MRLAAERDVLAMSVTAEQSSENRPEYGGMLLRAVLPTDRLIAEQAARLHGQGLRALSIVGPNDPDAPDPRHSAMRAAFASCTDCRLSEVTYPHDTDVWRYDWLALGQRVRDGSPEAIFLTATNPQALLDTVYATEAAGYAGRYYLAYGGFISVLVGAFPGSDVDGRLRSHELALPDSPRLADFLTRYEERHGEAFAPEPRLAAFADYLALLSLAIGSVGDTSPERVSREMRRIANGPGAVYGPLDHAAALAAVRAGEAIDFDGLSGALDFDDRGDVSEGRIVEYGVDASGAITPL